MDEPPPDDYERFFEDFYDAGEGSEAPSQASSRLGAFGQIAAGVLVVMAMVALLVGGAVALRWMFH